MTGAYVRFLAATDDSPAGRLAFDVLLSMASLVPIRPVTMTGGLIGRWEAARAFLGTPMVGTPINVVCCDPLRWAWTQRVAMPERDAPHDHTIPHETATAHMELYTAGMRNVLITNAPPIANIVAPARRYDAMAVTSEELRIAWERDDCRAVVLQSHARDNEVVRRLLGL